MSPKVGWLTIFLSLLLGSVMVSAQEIDLVMLVDESGSIDSSELDLEIDGLINAINNVVVPFVNSGGTVRIAVVSFGTYTNTRIGLVDVSTNKQQIVDALNVIKAYPDGGGTNMSGAIGRGKEILDDRYSFGDLPRGVVNLVTDGEPTHSPATTTAANNLKGAGYELWTLGVGSEADNSFLDSIAGPLPARNFPVYSFYNFEEAESEKLGEITSADTFNLVFLHGWLGNETGFETIEKYMKEELERRGYTVHTHRKQYANTEDVDTWAANIINSIENDAQFASLRNLILIGHSMGGKAAFRALSLSEDFAEKVKILVTINTPYDKLADYNTSIKALCKTATWGHPGWLPYFDQGACDSLANYDSCSEDAWNVIVRSGIRVIALVSAELTDSTACDYLGAFDDLYDGMRDDGIVPLVAQYCGNMEVVPYGRYIGFCHTDYGGEAAWLVARQIILAIEGSSEKFRGGDFSKHPWETGGDGNWSVVSSASHSHGYSAQAPISIGDDENSYLKTILDVVADGIVSFWIKVSSESGYDSLQFYIDGIKQGEWSGEHGWTKVSYPVSGCTHTFKWLYTKDSSVSSGQDTAWIDDIDFPTIQAKTCVSNSHCGTGQFCNKTPGYCETEGICTDISSGFCFQIYDPVCGCDGTTYGNGCYLARAGVSLAYEGECRVDTPAVFRVESSGNVLADGTFYGQNFLAGSADIAEWVSVSELVEAGDVLELDPNNAGHYRKSRGPCSTLVAGVVSTDPGFVLGSEDLGSSSGLSTLDFRSSTADPRLTTDDSALLALIGIVPVKVTDEGGPIKPGDLLVASSIPGYAMRWDADSGEEACGLIGKALEGFESGEGILKVLLMR